MAIHRAAPPMQVPATPAPAAAFTERLLLMVLYVTVLASSVAFIEPSPHDALMGVLALACLVAGVRFERHIALLFLLLLIWNVAGLLSLLNVPGQEQTVQYAGTSIYLAVAAVLFASLFAHNTMPRLVTVRAAYVLTATADLACGHRRLFPSVSRRPRSVRDLRPRARRLQGSQRVRPVPDLAGAGGARADAGAPHPHRRRPDRRHPAARPAVELFARRLVSFRGVVRRHDDARFRCGSRRPRTRLRIFAHECDRRRRAGGVHRHSAVVRLDREHVPGARAARSSPTTSAAAAVSACRNWRSPICSIFRTAWARSNSPACTACSSTTSICRPSWSMAGSAAWPISRCWLRRSGSALRTRLRAHAVAALSHLRVRRLRGRSARRLRDRHRSLAAFLSSARHDLGLGGSDVQSRSRAVLSRCRRRGSPMSHA